MDSTCSPYLRETLLVHHFSFYYLLVHRQPSLCYSSYDEEEDCLSPNIDDVNNTDGIDESSVEESTLSESLSSARLREPPGATPATSRPQGSSPGGFVNLSTIYALGPTEKEKCAGVTTPTKNGYATDKKLPEKPIPPEKPVSLMMVNGKMDNRYAGFGNNSFLYSHLLGSSGARVKDPPSYTAATSGTLFDKNGELKKATSPTRTLNRSPVTSPVNGMNKISDNYEKAVAERLSPQREISRVNRNGLFSKVNTGIVSSKVKKNNTRSEDDDDDYARDSDECSI